MKSNKIFGVEKVKLGVKMVTKECLPHQCVNEEPKPNFGSKPLP